MARNSLEFVGAVDKLTTDNEGYSKVVFEISSAYLDQALQLAKLTMKPLKITVEITT